MDFSTFGDDLAAVSGFLAMQGRADSPVPPPVYTPDNDSPRRRPAVGFDSYVDRYVRPDRTGGPSSRSVSPEPPNFYSDDTNWLGFRFVDELGLWESVKMTYRQLYAGVGKPDEIKKPLERLKIFREKIESQLRAGCLSSAMDVAQQARPIANACFIAGGQAWDDFKEAIYYLERQMSRQGLYFASEKEILAQPLRS